MKNVLLIIAVLLALGLKAQHSVTLTNGTLIKGRITTITKEDITIISNDSIHVYDCPISQIVSYDNGSGSVMLSKYNAHKPYNPRISTPGEEMKQATALLSTGLIITGIGIISAISLPYAIDKNSDNYVDNIKTAQLAGCGMVLLGTIFELSSISHFKLAGEKIDIKTGKYGLGVAMKF